MKLERRQLSWYVSAVLYRFSYIRIARQIDDDLFAYLGDKLDGVLAADCGCGPGHMAERLLANGVGQLLAIDHNASMLRQLKARVPEAVRANQVQTVHSRLSPSIFSEYLAKTSSYSGYGLILFKRSLYMPTADALSLLHAGVANLASGGALVVIHGERSLRRYAFSPEMKVASHTPFHLVNRFFSLLGHILGLGEYNLYTHHELMDLLTQAAGGNPVEIIPSKQSAYNLMAITA